MKQKNWIWDVEKKQVVTWYKIHTPEFYKEKSLWWKQYLVSIHLSIVTGIYKFHTSQT